MKDDRIALRCSDEEYEKIKNYSIKKNRTVNNLIVFILKNKVKKALK